MAAFLDVCRFTPTLGGTTDWTYSSAVTGYQGPVAAGAVNGAIYRYRAESADLSQWEVGYGAYNSTGSVFARTTVLFNSLGTTAKVSFSAAPQVAIVALAEDLLVTTPVAKSDQTTATSNALAVTPLHQQDHPSAAKAWVKFDGKTGATATIKASYNIASVTRSGTGTYVVTFTTAFSSADYAMSAVFQDPGTSLGASINMQTIAAGSITFSTRNQAANVDTDMSVVMLSFFGTQ